MASMRRGQALGLAFGIIVLYLLFFSGSDTDFRKTTESSLARRRGILRGDLSDADLTAKTNRELQMILDKQKQILEPSPAQRGEPNPWASSGASDDDAISVAGRKTMPKTKEKPRYPMDGVVGATDDEGQEVALNGGKAEKPEDEGETMARQELQSILKKSPIIIFSKSYCPYSKRAKALLLEKYTISPAPYVVELDWMNSPVPKPPGEDDGDDDAPVPTLGRKIQDLLVSLTGRRTVPNIMINTQSLGGSDDLAHLHSEGKLEEEIKRMGGKRIVSVERNHGES
ncbi:hypothetical protein A1O1_06595 [Capronia coronata CBS 617.96]|uniref:Uncharacterized protein n=1 Tax=Capronia coronata CBS 617.96 TaxID=1182541 RepID=W9Y993_9EURO|nr:uncharacterized protein A1O1_06595 [Capronia coronata CBS 617.96]EXJ86225.1 hypothetical protein A1O1_06595 [Capronia coronata CBS 617.96]